MKYKLVSSDYDVKTGHSKVVVGCKIGNFVGEADCHPEEEKPSSFFGCELAEVRARIKMNKALRREIYAKYKAIVELECLLKGMKQYSPNSIENRKIRKTKKIYEAELLNIQEEIDNLTIFEKKLPSIREERLNVLLGKFN